MNDEAIKILREIVGEPGNWTEFCDPPMPRAASDIYPEYGMPKMESRCRYCGCLVPIAAADDAQHGIRCLIGKAQHLLAKIDAEAACASN